MAYELIWESRGVVKRFMGKVSDQDMLQSVVDTEVDPRFDELRFVINDFLAMQDIAISLQVVEEISIMDSGAAFSNPRIKVAVVTTSTDVINLTTAYINSPLNQYPTRIFSTLDEARTWTASGRIG
jgi:hypothetical protein